jgi:hypothetical protein
VAMEQAEEYSEGSLKNKLGDCFIRGNNGARAGHCAARCCTAGKAPLCASHSRARPPFFPCPTLYPAPPTVLYISTPKRK